MHEFPIRRTGWRSRDVHHCPWTEVGRHVNSQDQLLAVRISICRISIVRPIGSSRRPIQDVQ